MALGRGDCIGQYQLTEDFRVAGGRSKISFAVSGGQRWFVKEFLSPKYPTYDSPGSERTKEYKRQQCMEFEAHQNKLMEVTRKACSAGSNLVCGRELVRVGTSYYKITEAIDTNTMSPKEVSQLSWKELVIILRSLVSSLRILHSNQIVHGDLKPENILIKKTSAGVYTTKLIDLDDSYFEGKPTGEREALVGTPEYYSPEVFAYIADEDGAISGETLTCKADIYTLGLILCEYLTGERPHFDTKKYAYAYAATLDGAKLVLPKGKYMTVEFQRLIEQMLERESEKRPNVGEVFEVLKKVDVNAEPKEGVARVVSDTIEKVVTAVKPSLKIRMSAAPKVETAMPRMEKTEVKSEESSKPRLRGTLLK